MPARRPEIERFLEKIWIEGEGSCWEWTASKIQGKDGGYGVMSAFDPTHGKVKNMLAHRWAYLHYIGPIPHGKIVMHTCDNRGCVNPEHLRLGTLQDNARDMIDKERWGGAWGEEHHNTELLADQVAQIRVDYFSGKSDQKTLAQRYGVSQATIGRITRGEVWASAGGPTGQGFLQRGEGHYRARLTDQQVREMRRLWKAGGVSQAELGRRFGVKEKTVCEIVNGRKRVKAGE